MNNAYVKHRFLSLVSADYYAYGKQSHDIGPKFVDPTRRAWELHLFDEIIASEYLTIALFFAVHSKYIKHCILDAFGVSVKKDKGKK